MRRRSMKVEQKEAEKPVIKNISHQFSFLDTAKNVVLPFNSISANLNDKKIVTVLEKVV